MRMRPRREITRAPASRTSAAPDFDRDRKRRRRKSLAVVETSFVRVSATDGRDRSGMRLDEVSDGGRVRGRAGGIDEIRQGSQLGLLSSLVSCAGSPPGAAPIGGPRRTSAAIREATGSRTWARPRWANAASTSLGGRKTTATARSVDGQPSPADDRPINQALPAHHPSHIEVGFDLHVFEIPSDLSPRAHRGQSRSPESGHHLTHREVGFDLHVFEIPFRASHPERDGGIATTAREGAGGPPLPGSFRRDEIGDSPHSWSCPFAELALFARPPRPEFWSKRMPGKALTLEMNWLCSRHFGPSWTPAGGRDPDHGGHGRTRKAEEPILRSRSVRLRGVP
jgi:hypothetical protein